MKMGEVPLRSIKCGSYVIKKQPGCFVRQKETISGLEFLWRGPEDSGFFGIQCQNISAIDLRVEAKFGSIDAMKGTLVVECSSPVLEMQIDSDRLLPLKSHIVHATFHVNQTGAMRDLLRELKSIRLNSGSNKGNASKSKQEVDPKRVRPKLKEGLPNWVSYIPHSMYSKRVRQRVELAISLYMFFSVAWAFWQLYRHVDFVRESVRPLLDFLQYQHRLFGHAMQFLNNLLEEYTTQWLCFIKPLYTVYSTIAAPLLLTLKQLAVITGMVKHCASFVWSMVFPMAKPVIYMVHSCKAVLTRLSCLFFGISVPQTIKQMLTNLWHVGYVPLDPIKAQLMVVRSIVMSSTKAIGIGTVRLVGKVYKSIWLRRSATQKTE